MKKNIFYIILGGILFTTVSVLAYNLSSNEVFYKKVNNQDMTVQQAIDDLYSKVPTPSGYTEEQYQAAQSSCPSGNACISNSDFGTPQYYAWNATPTSSTSKGSHNVYLAKWSDGQLGVCINRNGTEYCFRHNNWFAEREHLQQVFSGENDSCHVYSVGTTTVTCDAPDFYCYIYPEGLVFCSVNGGDEDCSVNGDGSVSCS